MGKLGLVIGVIMILSAANHSTAMKKNSNRNNSSSIRTSFMQGNNINGSMQERYRLMIEDDIIDVEFFLNPELKTPKLLDIAKSAQSYKPVIYCGRGKTYMSCLPDPQNSKISEPCRGLNYLPPNRVC